ncbi:hypothetical protein [Mariniflexile sp.]|uniref:hypothetical protein n=1 Tax=Mariniflexile sp. TaxID=1979402 RepID=UPI00356A380A
MPAEVHSKIQIGSKSLTIYKFTGKVAEAQKHLETKVSGGGGGGGTYRGTGASAPVSVTSTTITHDNIFLIDKEGNERALQLQDFNIACRPTNIITALWGIPEGKETGSYYAIINHTTQTTFFNNPALNRIASSCVNPIGNKYLGCLSIIVLIIICFKYPGLFILVLGYVVYFFVSVKKGKAKIKSNSKITSVESW